MIEETKAKGTNRVYLLVSIIILAGVLRFAAYPLTMTWSADSVTRTWIAMDWLESPHVITMAVWGPGYTYFLALIQVLTGDIFVAPVFINIILSLATAVILYFVTQRLFGDTRSSLFVAAAYALYPLAMRSSYLNMPETPTIFFLALTFYFLVRARSEKGNMRDAIFAGLCLTLAASMRFELWVYIPLLGIMLYKKYRLIIIFWIVAMLFPAYWMLSSYITEGDFFYSIQQSQNWEQVISGANEDVDTNEMIERIFYYPAAIVLGTTPILTVLIAAGIYLSWSQYRLHMLWLIAPLILAVLIVYYAINGVVETKSRYILSVIIFLFPFMAVAVKGLFKRKWGMAIGGVVLVTIIPLSYLGNFGTPDFLRALYASSYNAFPIVDNTNTEALKDLSRAVNNHMNSERGIISDFYNWTETYYVLYNTHLAREHFFVAPGEVNQELNEARAISVLSRYSEGLLLVQTGTNFADLIGFQVGTDEVELAGYTLELEELIGNFTLDENEIYLYRYTRL